MAKATAEVEDLLFNAAGNGNFKKVSNLFKSDKNINLGKQQAKCNINWLFFEVSIGCFRWTGTILNK